MANNRVNGKPGSRERTALFAQSMLFSRRANMARSTNNEIQLALDRALDGLAVVEAVETEDDVARVLIRGRTSNYRLRALWAGAGWPADVDRAIRHLDPAVFRAKWKESTAVGLAGFFGPFFGAAMMAHYVDRKSTRLNSSHLGTS